MNSELPYSSWIIFSLSSCSEEEEFCILKQCLPKYSVYIICSLSIIISQFNRSPLARSLSLAYSITAAIHALPEVRSKEPIEDERIRTHNRNSENIPVNKRGNLCVQSFQHSISHCIVNNDIWHRASPQFILFSLVILVTRIIRITRIGSNKLDEVIDFYYIRLVALTDLDLIILPRQFHRDHLPKILLTATAEINLTQVGLQLLGVLPVPVGNTERLIAVCSTHLIADCIAIPLLKAPVVGFCDLRPEVVRPVLILVDNLWIGDIE